MLVQSESCLGYVVIIKKILIFHPTAAFGSNSDKILLRDIQTLTLKNGMMTNARRSSAVPQVFHMNVKMKLLRFNSLSLSLSSLSHYMYIQLFDILDQNVDLFYMYLFKHKQLCK